jgi:hypothetical protein
VPSIDSNSTLNFNESATIRERLSYALQTVTKNVGTIIYSAGGVITGVGIAILKDLIPFGAGSVDFGMTLILAGLFTIIVGIAAD